MSPDFATQFAHDWIDAWNNHDLPRVLSHYTDDFEMTSPMIIQLVGEPSGHLRGKPAVAAYWSKGLELLPDLHFELISTLVGVNTLTIYFKGAPGRLAAEVFFFNQDLKVVRSIAHYAL